MDTVSQLNWQFPPQKPEFPLLFTEDTIEKALQQSYEGENQQARSSARHQLVNAADFFNETAIWDALVAHLSDLSYDATEEVLIHFWEVCPYSYKPWANRFIDWVLTREFRLNPPKFLTHSHRFPAEPDDLEPIETPLATLKRRVTQ